jgi:dynein assembly factor 3
MEGLGAHRLWGASPALDLLRARDELLAEGGAPDELRVLVVGSGDLRHALRTIAALRRKGRRERKVKIFLYDTPLECVARHLLLLAVLTDWAVPIRVRANTFLEVFGNALVQERTALYIARLGQELVSFVCNGKGPLHRFVDLSHLKVRRSSPCAALPYSAHTPDYLRCPDSP